MKTNKVDKQHKKLLNAAMKKKQKDTQILKKHTMGNIISPEDKRDFTAKSTMRMASAFPEEYCAKRRVGVMQQGVVGSCVGFAISATMQYGEYKAGFKNAHDFSRGFIYANRTPENYQGEGMVIREALKQINHCGDCDYSFFPWNENYPDVKKRLEKNKMNLLKEASPYKIINYFRCYTAQEIKQTIMQQGAILVSVPIYSGFGKNIELPTSDEKTSESHAMCCIGWNEAGWILQNSWGSAWGDGGFCYMPFNYPTNEWWGITIDKKAPIPKKKNLLIKVFQFLGYYAAQERYCAKNFIKSFFIKNKKK